MTAKYTHKCAFAAYTGMGLAIPIGPQQQPGLYFIDKLLS